MKVCRTCELREVLRHIVWPECLLLECHCETQSRNKLVICGNEEVVEVDFVAAEIVVVAEGKQITTCFARFSPRRHRRIYCCCCSLR